MHGWYAMRVTISPRRFMRPGPRSLACGSLGYGYFRISSPVAGWVDSRDIEAEFQTRCA